MNFYVVKIKGEANAYSRSAYKKNKSNKIRGFLTIIRRKKMTHTNYISYFY